MKKINLTVFISIFVCLLFSCSHGFLKDPRLYNTKKKTNNVIVVAPEPELQLTGGVDPFDDEGKWYNNPNEGFPHTDFETLSLVGTWFNDDNVPEYAMQKEDVWVSKDTSKSEFIHAKAPDTTGQGYGISNVHWYSYRGKNPLYAMDGAYNTQLQVTAKGNLKLSRFYFYRFTGDTLSPSLDNFLFAVDTYSKLMFAFAYPTKTENVFGNNVPKAWGPTDGSAFLGTNYQFYMYDPVGYVEKVDGKYNVVMYDWFKNNLAKGIYHPTLGGLDSKSSGTAFTETAQKEPSGAGKSPFNNHTADFFKENMKLLAGIPFYRREVTTEGANGLVLYKYLVSQDGKTITRTAESWNGLATDTDLTQKTYTVGEGDTATKGNVTGECNGELELADESRTLKFSNGEVASVTFIDSDPGPDWLLRVQGRSFETSDKVYKYVFSSDGRSVDYYKNGAKQETWTFYGIEDGNNTKAAYTGSGIVFKHWGFNLEGADDLYCTTGQGSTIYETLNMRTWADPAYFIRLKTDSFANSVKGMTFGLRKKDSEGLFGLGVEWYKFDSTGQNVTLTTETYHGNTTTNTYNVSPSNADSASFNGKNATLKTDGAHWTLVIGGDEYVAHYQDPGPSFVYRVKGKSFAGNSVFYVFSQDGKTLDYYDQYLDWFTRKWRKRSYTYSGEDTTNSDGELQVKYGGTWYTLNQSGTVISWWSSYAAPKKDKAKEVKDPSLPPIE